MNATLVVLSALLTVAAAGSGFGKLAKFESVMASMASVGVTPSQVPMLAVLEFAGAAGLVAGVWNRPLGIASAACLALYFLGAVVSHIRVRHGASEFGPAAAIFVISVAVTVLEVAR